MTYILYTHSRQFGPYLIPISVQSVYLKNYVMSKSLPFSLSLTEYPLEGCYFALIQRLFSIHNPRQICIITTSIYVFSDLLANTNAYLYLSKYDIIITAVLEKFTGNLDDTLKIIADNNQINQFSSASL